MKEFTSPRIEIKGIMYTCFVGAGENQQTKLNCAILNSSFQTNIPCFGPDESGYGKLHN